MMCGIAGELRFGEDEAALASMEEVNLRQMARGPDSGGIFRQNRMALGHRRLKIFDLSERAAQPMVDYALGLALVFNGAIYNFRELRAELKTKGYHFTSEGDTEVLLKAFHAWGESCVEKLCGMFSFAVWERDSGVMTLARDRMGIKPLYYAETPSGFRFASSLPALLVYEDIDRAIDPEALHYYLNFHAVPEPLTILSGIRKLMPGTIMQIYPDGRKTERRYWRFDLPDAPPRTQSAEAWTQEAHQVLRFALGRQLIADVPVGILLSGGLDSSLLVALAAEQSSRPVETFSIGFESANGESGDEFYYSDKVAAHFGTRHHRMFISNKQLADSLASCVAAMSEPMVSHDNIGFYLLSREVSRHVKVALSGQGADEIFAGYHWFQKLGGVEAGPDAATRIGALVRDRSFAEYEETVTPAFRTADLAQEFLVNMVRENGSRMLLNHVMEYESTFALSNGPLGRVDNMTMASSLEARVPLLDESVIDFAASLPIEMKLGDGGKAILKLLGRKLLPRQVVDRPKGYFPVPALKYVQGPTLDLMREVLSPARVQARGIFNPQKVKTLLEEPHAHLTRTGGSKLWQLGLLEFWLQQQGI
jgi:asparagine synthase (glutamine-hydrolysing)